MFIIVYKTLYANAVKRKVNLTSTVKRRQHPLNRLFIHFKVHIKKKNGSAQTRSTTALHRACMFSVLCVEGFFFFWFTS